MFIFWVKVCFKKEEQQSRIAVLDCTVLIGEHNLHIFKCCFFFMLFLTKNHVGGFL